MSEWQRQLASTYVGLFWPLHDGERGLSRFGLDALNRIAHEIPRGDARQVCDAHLRRRAQDGELVLRLERSVEQDVNAAADSIRLLLCKRLDGGVSANEGAGSCEAFNTMWDADGRSVVINYTHRQQLEKRLRPKTTSGHQ